VNHWDGTKQRVVLEQGNPLLGGGELAVGCAAQFVTGAGGFDQFGPPKSGHDSSANFSCSSLKSIFHAGSMTKPVGQRLSK
jgi:hypothetical protein